MVVFSQIPYGILVAISCVMFGLANAAPSPIDSKKSSGSDSSNNDSSEKSFTLPPLIPNRVIPPHLPHSPNNFDVESENIARNLQWFQQHGGNMNVTKREDNTVGGMTLEVPENAPPIPGDSNGIIKASSSQINSYKKYTALANIAYCEGVVPLTNWICKRCLNYVPDGKIIKTFTSYTYDINGYILRSDAEKTIYLAFRGTKSFKNAVADLQFVLKTYPNVKGAKVHEGFLEAYNEVIASFFPTMLDQITAFPKYKVVILGHSLGGAQALLAGIDLYQRDVRFSPDNMSIVTAGCPRVGNPTFAQYFNSIRVPFTRIVNKRDIVPHLPPQSFGFLHPGIEVWIKSTNNIQICEQNTESKKCSNSIVPFTSIYDHTHYFYTNESDKSCS
ncbi:lipase [Gilbertella persicaria]|uniref:lipase n=1 Tax=Gilbertella persicaria TaxID=101096 RepID=UPI00221F45F3|nr:lipase [Gilbertella persicaria]KAI8090273.1 lipase [Gilbertella persicaria]